MSDHSRIVILDFGSQYTQVIARRIRECQVYSQIVPYHTSAKEIAKLKPRGLILSGGPASVYGKKAPHPDAGIFDLGAPVLGICYGVQLMAHLLGGKVEHSERREYGPAKLRVKAGECALFAGLGTAIDIWNSHGDKVTKLPRGFRPVATTDNAPYAAVEHAKKKFFGLQFHPEVVHTPRGREILENFVHRICGCGQDWTMGGFIEETCAKLRAQIGSDHVILGLSGGVDSSVAAALLHKAIGDQLTCVFVNNGLLRANEAEAVQRLFGEHFHMRLKTVNATAQFLRKLRGVTAPERKRKIIGREFIRVFDATVTQLSRGKKSKYRWLGQGTLYPDVIESVAIDGNPAALIKSHHNVGGLPKRMKLKLVEPLRELFKDEVREVGAQLGLPREVTGRQPFPGPGLAVRILGEITREKLRILREADSIVVSEMKAADWYYQVWQSFAVLLPVRSVGVMGDERTYAQTIALRIVGSVDGMTADWTRLPYDLLARISARIINEVKGVNRVCYDISSKPPATIEWE